MIPRKDHGRPEIIDVEGKDLKIQENLEAYEEVPDQDQPRTGTSWVVTPKLADDKDAFKARLVCPGDQENLSLLTDSPTCS